MKSCKVCREKFQPARALQSVCSTACALAQAQRKREKQAAVERRETATKMVALKTRTQLIKEAQAAFNGFIRARDAARPCVSCGRHHHGQWHAGHYMSTGARPELRFDEANVHKQCQPCNTHLSGNLVLYRAELIRRVGSHEVERLEGPASTVKLSREEIILLKAKYAAKAREALKAPA